MPSAHKQDLGPASLPPETPATRLPTDKRPDFENAKSSGDGLLHRLRNTWQFANLCQWIYIFGKVVNIDESVDVDELEAACLSPDPTLLLDLGLSLLKWVSSHRGLNRDLFDEYTRRQYVAKAPHCNPFGTGELAARFVDFDIFTKLRVLHQLTRWVMLSPDRIRDKMGHPRDSEQATWRIEPFGWDAKDRTYFVLDDNRLYRLTEPAAAPPRMKKPVKAKAARRSSKRLCLPAVDGDLQSAGGRGELGLHQDSDNSYDRLGGMTWECIAVTFDEARHFVSTQLKMRDENEKILRNRLEEHLLPMLKKNEESRQRKAAQREKELLALEKLAHAKRSSRIASRRQQKQAQEEAKKEEDRRRAGEEATAVEEARRVRIEQERDRKLVSREQRLKDREARRSRHAEELTQLSQDTQSRDRRVSDRHLQGQIRRKRRALEDLNDEEEDWIFDCVCGVYGHVYDGTHSIACERCNIWQHSKCVGISEPEADRKEFIFVCQGCLGKASPLSRTLELKAHGHRPLPTTPPAELPQQQIQTMATEFPASLDAKDSLNDLTDSRRNADHRTQDGPADSAVQREPQVASESLSIPPMAPASSHHPPPPRRPTSIALPPQSPGPIRSISERSPPPQSKPLTSPIPLRRNSEISGF